MDLLSAFEKPVGAKLQPCRDSRFRNHILFSAMKIFSSELIYLTNVREFGAWATHGDANVPAMPRNVDENTALRVDRVAHAKSLRAVAVKAVQEHSHVDTEVNSNFYVRTVRRSPMAICSKFVHGT